MLTFKNYHGQLHKANTVFVVFTAIYVTGGLAILSTPLWRPSTCKLAAFAATPFGMGLLAFVAAALTYLGIYAISKNNEISELKASKIVVKDDKVMLQVTKEVHEEIKANNQNKNERGEVIKDEYRIYFSLEGKDYYVTGEIGDGKAAFGDTVFLGINSLAKKDDKGEYVSISDNEKQLEELGLNKGENKGVNTYLGSLIVEQVASEQKVKN